ncbi:hypothetical protein ACG7TL_005614 [Trametes sanguinea]
MGRKAKPLPPGFQELVNGEAKTVLCTSCNQTLKRESITAHMKAATHKKSTAAHGTAATQTAQANAMAQVEEAARAQLDFAQLHAGGWPKPAQKPEDRGLPGGTWQKSHEADQVWDTFLQEGADFSVDDHGLKEAERRAACLREELESFGLWNPERTASDLGFQFGQQGSQEEPLLGVTASAEEDAFLADILSDRADHTQDGFPTAAESDGADLLSSDPTSDNYPYPNYPTFLLDTLDHLLRIPIADALMKMFIYTLRECGVKVPSFDGFRKLQARLREKCGVPTIPCKSARGNVFWMIDPRELLAKDWSNPAVRPHIHVYPEIPEGPISEVWHAGKWHSDMNRSMLSPMYDAGDRHFYVDELSRLDTGELVIPSRWIMYRGELHFDSHRVTLDEQGLATVDYQSTEMIPARKLVANYHDLEADATLPQWAGPAPDMPNALREIAQGEPLYTSFINHFADDVSGNRSKSWNKHINTYMTHANLPRKLLQQEGNIHFVSTSPHASAAEQFGDFKRIVISTHQTPVRVIDPTTRQAVRFRIFIQAELSDNPMQRGTTNFKATDEGFHTLFLPGTHRSKESVLNAVREQVRLACLGVEKAVRTQQTETGVKDQYTEPAIIELIKRAREEKRTNPGRAVEDIQRDLLSWVDSNLDAVYNPFLTMPGLDPTQDTPVEILHTVLLGVVKYAWHWTHTSWTPTQKAIYVQRLQATATDGLSIHAIRANYIVQYANSLIGRQLKTVTQATAFHVHDLLPTAHFKLWLAIGELTAYIWFPEIDDQERYKSDLATAIANVLDIIGEIDPSKIVEKVKLHVLSHGVEDVARFGPLIGMCTEGFESFNGVFRNASIHSNHLAPSRDIAQQLADQEAHKHRLMGGLWLTTDGDWVHAGSRVRDFLHRHPMLRRLFGWSATHPPVPGTYTLAAVPSKQSFRPTKVLGDTHARYALNASTYALDSAWTVCRNIVSRAQDVCIAATWVCARSPVNPSIHVMGRVVELLAKPEMDKAIVVLDLFEVASTRHPKFNMPWLIRRQDEASYMIVEIKAVLFAFNAQHDCAAAGCAATGERNVQQERVNSSVREKFIEHQNVHRYIINMHSLHNPHLIRSVLPHDLTAPIPHFTDRRKAHDQLAKALRDSTHQKQVAAAARKAAKQATVALNKVPSGINRREPVAEQGVAGEDQFDEYHGSGIDRDREPSRKRQRQEEA